MNKSQTYILSFLTLALILSFVALMSGKMIDTTFSGILTILIPSAVGLFVSDNYNKRVLEQESVKQGLEPRGIL